MKNLNVEQTEINCASDHGVNNFRGFEVFKLVDFVFIE